MKDPRVIGARLRGVRRDRGLSQAEVALRAELSPGRIGQLERGDAAVLREKVVRPVAAALGVSIDWLLTGRGPKLDERVPSPQDAEMNRSWQQLSDADKDLFIQLLQRLLR